MQQDPAVVGVLFFVCEGRICTSSEEDVPSVAIRSSIRTRSGQFTWRPGISRPPPFCRTRTTGSPSGRRARKRSGKGPAPRVQADCQRGPRKGPPERLLRLTSTHACSRAPRTASYADEGTGRNKFAIFGRMCYYTNPLRSGFLS